MVIPTVVKHRLLEWSNLCASRTVSTPNSAIMFKNDRQPPHKNFSCSHLCSTCMFEWQSMVNVMCINKIVNNLYCRLAIIRPFRTFHLFHKTYIIHRYTLRIILIATGFNYLYHVQCVHPAVFQTEPTQFRNLKPSNVSWHSPNQCTPIGASPQSHTLPHTGAHTNITPNAWALAPSLLAAHLTVLI